MITVADLVSGGGRKSPVSSPVGGVRLFSPIHPAADEVRHHTLLDMLHNAKQPMVDAYHQNPFPPMQQQQQQNGKKLHD